MPLRAALLAVALLPVPALAGHGLLNSFSSLEWLPAPDRTPDQWHYGLDTLRENLQLMTADGPSAQFALCLIYLREKLAEAEAMVSKNDRAAATIASLRYREYLGRALALTEQATGTQATSLRAGLALALLEHRYILSVDYPDLPAASRSVIANLITDAGTQYDSLRAKLPHTVSAPLFFKEEEVRWSWEMAQRAAEQGL